MIRIDGDERGDFRSQPGLRISDDVWMLDPDHYRPFIEAATGASVPDDLSPSDCYRIGNLLEAFIEETKENGELTPEAVGPYPVVESPEEVFWIARFFRECHRCELSTDPGGADRTV